MDEPVDAGSKPFTLTWDALKLLGKNLYSHPWAAISELVANGIDARAANIYVHLDISGGNEKAVLEILDDGVGMGATALSTYVNIGHNKRLALSEETIRHPMGRKGIGKLAALYLSGAYNLLTKVAGRQHSIWCCSIPQDMSDKETPELKRAQLSQTISSKLRQKWEESSSGTLLQIVGIDLRKFGEKAFEGLQFRLANHFLLSELEEEVRILFALTQAPGSAVHFSEVTKNVASKNFLYFMSTPELGSSPSEFASKVWIKNRGEETLVEVQKLRMKEDNVEHELSGEIELFPEVSGKTHRIAYSLTGWLGMHSTIDGQLARKNDHRFVRNRYFTPSQIRLYVRGKLASENILPLLSLTQTYSNYIEGEVSFDILDDDALPDIATTSREGFDTSDPRIELLVSILRPQVRHLITLRNELNSELDAQKKVQQEERQNKAVNEAANQLKDEAKKLGLEAQESASLAHTFLSRFKGQIFAKEDYSVFLSHASADKYISDAIWELLSAQGVKDDEVFYTSRDQTDDFSRTRDVRDLEGEMRTRLRDENTRIIYATGPKFKDSEFCLFEAGAGWALRTPSEFEVLASRAEHAPYFFKNARVVNNLFREDNGVVLLERKGIEHLIQVLNTLIEHINYGRRINDEPEVKRFEITLPKDVQIRQAGKELLDYLPQGFREQIELMRDGYAAFCENSRAAEAIKLG